MVSALEVSAATTKVILCREIPGSDGTISAMQLSYLLVPKAVMVYILLILTYIFVYCVCVFLRI